MRRRGEDRHGVFLHLVLRAAAPTLAALQTTPEQLLKKCKLESRVSCVIDAHSRWWFLHLRARHIGLRSQRGHWVWSRHLLPRQQSGKESPDGTDSPASRKPTWLRPWHFTFQRSLKWKRRYHQCHHHCHHRHRVQLHHQGGDICHLHHQLALYVICQMSRRTYGHQHTRCKCCRSVRRCRPSATRLCPQTCQSSCSRCWAMMQRRMRIGLYCRMVRSSFSSSS
mmetsp:Transcript_9712/g.17769  ORF Transcript_9712/g.17769 Transcript_9712/m.17769 type:complete len:224 (+) Transcript_9712:261-932(+)